MLARELGKAAFNFTPDAADGDAEDALSALDKVNDFICGSAFVHAGAVAHQGDLGEVLDAAFAQVLHGGADLLQRDSGVQETLDDLQDEDVPEAVQALCAGAGGAADGGLHQSGAGPVVELAVGDPGSLAGSGTPVACVFIQDGQVFGEQQVPGHLPAEPFRVLRRGVRRHRLSDSLFLLVTVPAKSVAARLPERVEPSVCLDMVPAGTYAGGLTSVSPVTDWRNGNSMLRR